MRALLLRTSHRTACISMTTSKSPAPASLDTPILRTRRPSAAPASWRHSQRATYYFDASNQSVKTLRVLLAKCQPGADRLGLHPSPQQLAQSFDVLLASICPGMDDDGENRDYFLALLRMHLSGLAVPELQNLAKILKSLRYDCYVTESVNADEFFLEYGFSNGPPYHRQRTLLQITDLFHLLDELQQQTVGTETTQRPLCTEALAPIARTWLASCAASWLQSDQSFVSVLDAARELADLLDVPVVLQAVVAATLSSRASVLELQNGQLLIERDVATQLGQDKSGKLFAYVLRDLLELMLTRKLIGSDAAPLQLTPGQRCNLLDTLAQIIDYGKPPAVGAVMQAQADAILANANHFGKVQILPTIGAALGHAWITPALSLTTDASKKSIETGTRFMHSGFQLMPRESVIREWSTRFLSAQENEHVFSAARAWHLPVPVDTQRLQLAADEIIREWRDRGLPYRFIGTEPAVEATGCRITVWQAVQRGLTTDALTLFQHYNRGLPEPESPTELWLRLDGMRRWMEQIKAPNPGSL